MKYLAYYDTAANAREKRYYTLAATNKIDYILDALSALGEETELFSASGTNGVSPVSRRRTALAHGNRLLLCASLGKKNKGVKALDLLYRKLQTLFWLLGLKKGQTLLCYHSLSYMGEVALAKRLKGFRLILEMEELYGDLEGSARYRRRELRAARRADGFLLPTALLNGTVNPEGKPAAILHGTCRAEADRGAGFGDGKIHVVYAGTFAPRKGALTAIQAAAFLSAEYHLHILGFGRPQDEERVRQAVAQAASWPCAVTLDGCLAGEAYLRFLQGCQIGLSTQTPQGDYNATSFPSKILSYLANGLRVVSIRIPAVEESAVGDQLHYYDTQTPEAIAGAIRGVDLRDGFDGRKVIRQLDQRFQKDLAQLLREVKT